jgi:multicomponent K+:H+ antiporter subunit E
MKRLIPSPPLSLTLFVVWLLLNQSLEASTLVSGIILGLVVPLLTQGLRPATVRMRRPRTAVYLAVAALADMLESARAVAWALLTQRNAGIHGRFVVIPLDMRDPNGLAVLAMISCLTPGTAWGELSLDRSKLLMHVFDLDDEAAFIARVKQRYERPLLEIFETDATP